MAACSIWVKDKEGQQTDGDTEDNQSDIWDDTALIEAYDRAINSFKNGFQSKDKTDKSFINSNTKKKKKRKSLQKEDKYELNQMNIGDKCHAIYSEDGLLYSATITDIDTKNKTYTVQFDYYDNIETVSFSDTYNEHYTTQDMTNDTLSRNGNIKSSNKVLSYDHHWNIGDICLAYNQMLRKYEEAVIVKLSRNNCVVTFIESKSKETVKLSSIKDPKKYSNQCNCDHPARDKDKGNHSYFGSPFYPSFPSEPFMPPQPFSSVPFSPCLPYQFQDFLHQTKLPFPNQPSTPPPPPPLPFPSQIEDGDENALANMLMSWYMVGYHTGFYQGTKKATTPKEDESESSNHEMKNCESTSEYSGN